MTLLARVFIRCNRQHSKRDHIINVYTPGDESVCLNERSVVIGAEDEVICLEDHDVDLDVALGTMTGEEPLCIELLQKPYIVFSSSVSSKTSLPSQSVLALALGLDFTTSSHLLEKLNISLINAVQNGEYEVVKYLAEHGATLNYRNNEAAKESAIRGDLDILKYLVSKGVDPKLPYDLPFLAAIRYGRFNVVQYLAEEHNSNVNDPSAIINAACSGELGILQYLVSHGATVHCSNNLFESPLIAASEYGYLDIVKYLIEEHNIDNKESRVTGRYKNRDTSILKAAEYGHLDVIKYLHSQGSHLELLNTAIMNFAAGGGYADIVEYLVQEYPLTRLHSQAVLLAAQADHLHIVKYLVEHGAPCNKEWLMSDEKVMRHLRVSDYIFKTCRNRGD